MAQDCARLWEWLRSTEAAKLPEEDFAVLHQAFLSMAEAVSRLGHGRAALKRATPRAAKVQKLKDLRVSKDVINADDVTRDRLAMLQPDEVLLTPQGYVVGVPLLTRVKELQDRPDSPAKSDAEAARIIAEGAGLPLNRRSAEVQKLKMRITRARKKP